MPAGKEDRIDLTAYGFLRLLKEFWAILLQDSVIMGRSFPGHLIWTDLSFVRQCSYLPRLNRLSC
jgi:hypothetical protein